MAERAESTSKRLGGTPAFLFATVATFAAWRNVPFRVTVDDEPPLELVANNVICANGRAFGGGIKVCPQAEPDDGLLDVLVWGDVGKLDLALNLPRLYRGTHLGHRKVTVLRARRVHVEPSRPLPLELDGELPGTTPATFEIAPGALRLRVPGLGQATISTGAPAGTRRSSRSICSLRTRRQPFETRRRRCGRCRCRGSRPGRPAPIPSAPGRSSRGRARPARTARWDCAGRAARARRTSRSASASRACRRQP